MGLRARLRPTLDRLARVGVLPTDGEEERLRKESLTLFALLITVLASLWVVTYAALGLWRSAAIPLAYQVASVTGIALFARNHRWGMFRASQLGLMLMLPFVLQWSLGGFEESSGIALWAVVAPFGALVFSGPRQAVPWFLAFVALLAFSAAIDSSLPSPTEEIPASIKVAFFALNIGAVSLTAFLLLEYFVRARERAHELLAAERERSERLLLNILPAEIAERLKTTSGVIAERQEEVSVLFADLSGFTPAVERLSPEGLVGLLDEIFSVFDDLVAAHGLEKIKTIGDGYMVAGGIPTPRADHAEQIAALALAMQVGTASCSHGEQLMLRVGIDSGPVVAGVIGRTKFGYDLWGDTVNTASRMESHAPPGTIQVTARTHARLADLYEFERRDDVAIKGKGTMTTYLLLGPRAPVSEDAFRVGSAPLTGS